MESTIVPITVCFILPVSIVALVMWTRRHEVSKKAEIILRAIENGAAVDTNLLNPSKKSKTVKQKLLDKFTGGCITSFMGAAFLILSLLPDVIDVSFSIPAGCILLAVGIGLFVSYFVGKKMFEREIMAQGEFNDDPGK